MPSSHATPSTVRQRATLLTILFLVVVGAALGVGAWQLARAQSNERKDLESRYASRAPIATALVDSLFQLVFQQQAANAAKTLSGDVTDAQLDKLLARGGTTAYQAIIAADGHLIAGSSRTPERIRDGQGIDSPHVKTALQSKTKTGLSDAIESDGKKLIETAVSYPAPDGMRVLITGSPLDTYASFLSGAIKPLAPVVGGSGFVLDGKGNVLGSVISPGVPRVPDRALVVDSAKSDTGKYTDNQEKFFAAATVPETNWRIAISAPTSRLYGTSNGTGRWLPWLVLGLCALAFATVALLIRRTVVAGERLALANAELERSQGRLRDRAAELTKSNTELQRSNSDLEQFAYVASHDLSAPLRAVAGFSQLLAARYKGRLDTSADEFIGHMQQGVDRMQRIIDDLLAYSRVDRGDLSPDEIGLEDVLGEVLHGLGPDLSDHGATVTHDPLPVVRGERGQLGQVLQNLIANGVKFTAPGVTPHVHVTARPDGDGMVRVEVRDNGIGIDPEHAERIFKMFQRLHGPEEYPGTGIGLAISKKIVERHGGQLFVEAGAEGGSTFVFTLQGESAGA